MTTSISESKILTKHISCECKYKFYGTKCKSNQWWDNDKYWCKFKNINVCEKDYVWNPATCNCEYLASIMDDSTIIRDEIINVKETNFNDKYITCKTQHFCILLAFWLITIFIN